jgi:hypothetical protein
MAKALLKDYPIPLEIQKARLRDIFTIAKEIVQQFSKLDFVCLTEIDL